ncbi:LemA family protein [Flavobacterium sp. MAH-1]|uniref:LemA family protein n=1 Tax=Flavobacterium agri TaxID=2743471 RepID=A0A7Y8Y5U4_9FLAO|nr:LemA family protein [Flavobacterium agri]NUY81816.1 LemA family protein [Flavobacterium agri]NYA71840.1 LemA family protein [Flavobacterium agri]
MKRFLPWIIGIGAILGIILLVVIYSFSVKNSALRKDQDVQGQWADVEAAYQRRNDLIQNLVNTVKGAADFEKSTLTAVIEARSKATSVQVDPTNITPEQLTQFQQAQSGVSSALGRLLVTVEKYPDLKANQNFLKLQDELASTENQILTARTRFNEKVRIYNSYILAAPQSFFLGSYAQKPFFKSTEGADKPVEVKF